MNFYEIRACCMRGAMTTVCVAALNHQEAVDALIEERARAATEVYDRYLTCTEANALLYDLEWLGLYHGRGGPAWEVTVWELGMPPEPGLADHKDSKTIDLDIEGSLKRQGLIDLDFTLGCCDDETVSCDEA